MPTNYGSRPLPKRIANKPLPGSSRLGSGPRTGPTLAQSQHQAKLKGLDEYAPVPKNPFKQNPATRYNYDQINPITGEIPPSPTPEYKQTLGTRQALMAGNSPRTLLTQGGPDPGASSISQPTQGYGLSDQQAAARKDAPGEMIANSPYLQKAVPPAMQEQLTQPGGAQFAVPSQNPAPSSLRRPLPVAPAGNQEAYPKRPQTPFESQYLKLMEGDDPDAATAFLVQQAKANVANRQPDRKFGGSDSGNPPLQALMQPSQRNQQVYSEAYNQALESRMNQNGASGIERRLGLQDQTSGVKELVNNTQQKPAFQPQRVGEGILGESMVEMTPTGGARLTGRFTPERMKELGIDSEESRAANMTRQRANTRRMENMLAAKRLGQQYDPGDPVRPGEADPSVYTARLGDMRQDKDRFSNMLTQRNLDRQGRTTGNSIVDEELNRGSERKEVDPEVAARNLRLQAVNIAMDPRREGTITPDQVPVYGDAITRYVQGGSQQAETGEAGGNNAGNITVARAAIQGITDPVEARDKLLQQGFDPSVVAKIYREMTATMTPSQQQAAQSRSNVQNRDRGPTNQAGRNQNLQNSAYGSAGGAFSQYLRSVFGS